MVRILPIIQLRRGFFAAGMCLALSACDNPWLEEKLSLDTVLSKSWLSGNVGIEPASLKPEQPLYCYETLGTADCYDQPLEDGGNRLVGFEGPAPVMDPLPTAQ